MKAVARYLLLQDWSNSAGDLGSFVFFAGKAVGILGRILSVLLIITVVIGAFFSSSVLLIAGYGSGLALFTLVGIEVTARLLMLGGNLITSLTQRRGK